jgi:ribosomal protein L11 methylase PrmA
MTRSLRALAAAATAAMLNACKELEESSRPSRAPDVLYARTPQAAVETMLRLARAGPRDVLYDLGSGDGRIPITAARKYGMRAVGIELDPARIAEARERAEGAGVDRLVQFREQDLFEAPIAEASIVTLFLLPHLNLKLRERLWRELRPGTRVLSYRWDMGDWPPEKTVAAPGGEVHLWIVPRRH